MPHIAFAGAATTLTLPLAFNGKPLPADAGNLTWSLLDHTMAPVAGVTPAPVSVVLGQTEVLLTIPLAGQAKAADVEGRFLRYTWTSGGASYSSHLGYMVADWAPLMATVEDVRRVLGVREIELASGDIDVFGAWLKIRTEVTPVTAFEWLTATDDRCRKMNEAIALFAAGDAARYMQLRLAQKMSSDTLTFERMKGIDLDTLASDLYSRARALLTTTGEDEALPSTFFTLAGPAVDAVTGA